MRMQPGDVAVVVVLIAVQAVVPIVAEGLVGDAGNGARAREPVANVVVAVGDGAVFAVFDGAPICGRNDLFCLDGVVFQPIDQIVVREQVMAGKMLFRGRFNVDRLGLE